MPDLAACNASRKADREAIAASLIVIAAKYGATATRRDAPRHIGWSGASIVLNFTLNGVGAMTNIDDLHGGYDALIRWYNDDYPARDFSPVFNCAVGDLNHYRKPHHKATSSGSWARLTEYLEGGLELAANGRAFAVESVEP